MQNTSIATKIKKLNDIIKKQMWMDFDFVGFDGYELTIHGSIDLSSSDYFISLKFIDVDYVSLSGTWSSDTSKDVLRILNEKEITEMRPIAIVNSDCFVFQFIPEVFDSLLYIAAKDFSYECNPNALKASRE